MALRADVQYVQYSVDGTAARKVERHAVEGVTPVQKRRKAEHKVIAVDPVALAGILLSAVVLIAMVCGLMQYRQEMQRSRQMGAYVEQLKLEKSQLEQTYKDGYDLDEIRDIAMNAGMVPAAEMEQISIAIQKPDEKETELSFWESVATFLTGIFA